MRAGFAISDRRDLDFIRDLPYLRAASTSQEFGAEDDATMPEYDMPIEEQIKVLVKEFRTLRESVDTRFDSVDAKLTTVDGKVTTLDAKVASLDPRVATLDTKVTSLDTKVTSLDTKVTSLDTKVTSLDTKVTSLDTKVDKVQLLLEETHAIARLSLEGLQGLRESTVAKFSEAAKTNAGQTDLLKSVLVHVRKRVEHLERPKRRRRP